MQRWLDTYAYKVDIRWDLFATPILILMSIALITISAQVVKGALANPAAVLKSD
jgi:putative ABC transport system permease protein